MKSLRLSRNVRLENLKIDNLIFTLIHMPDSPYNYQLLSLLGLRMSRENKGADISLSRNNYQNGRLELEIKLPRKFWKLFTTRGQVERAYRLIAKSYKIQLSAFFRK